MRTLGPQKPCPPTTRPPRSTLDRAGFAPPEGSRIGAGARGRELMTFHPSRPFDCERRDPCSSAQFLMSLGGKRHRVRWSPQYDASLAGSQMYIALPQIHVVAEEPRDRPLCCRRGPARAPHRIGAVEGIAGRRRSRVRIPAPQGPGSGVRGVTRGSAGSLVRRVAGASLPAATTTPQRRWAAAISHLLGPRIDSTHFDRVRTEPSTRTHSRTAHLRMSRRSADLRSSRRHL
jgi:hypothetical protein